MKRRKNTIFLFFFKTWVDSGKVEESLPETADLGNCDLGISADVIEHIHDPDNLIDYMKKLHCKVSTITIYFLRIS